MKDILTMINTNNALQRYRERGEHFNTLYVRVNIGMTLNLYLYLYCQAQPKSQLSWAEVAVLWPFPTARYPQPATTLRSINKAIFVWNEFVLAIMEYMISLAHL